MDSPILKQRINDLKRGKNRKERIDLTVEENTSLI